MSSVTFHHVFISLFCHSTICLNFQYHKGKYHRSTLLRQKKNRRKKNGKKIHTAINQCWKVYYSWTIFWYDVMNRFSPCNVSNNKSQQTTTLSVRRWEHSLTALLLFLSVTEWPVSGHYPVAYASRPTINHSAKESPKNHTYEYTKRAVSHEKS